MEVFNLFGDDWDRSRDRDGWRWRQVRVGDRLGAERIGASVYEVEPGQKTFPYHFQYAVEEWLIVLRGEPTLRTPEGERRLSPGDCAVFKRGPAGAHLVRNDTDEPVRVLMLPSHAEVDVAVYPDSGKVGAFADEPPGTFRLIVPQDAEVDYFQGEE